MAESGIVTLRFVEQGHGAAVVFVHGAPADRRLWHEQRGAVSANYRFVAPDQRYFGSAPWPDDGANYSLTTHASDLAAFVRQLGVGPVHLVGTSYGGAVALVLAVQRPDLVRSLFVYEPALVSVVTDPTEQAALTKDRQGIAPAVAALQANDLERSVRLFLEWANNRPGCFDSWPASLRTMFMDNGRTIALNLAAPPPPPVSCAQLGGIGVPTTVARGDQTRPFYTILVNRIHRCIPSARLVVVPDARHLACFENPDAFNAALLGHLDGCREHATPVVRRIAASFPGPIPPRRAGRSEPD